MFICQRLSMGVPFLDVYVCLKSCPEAKLKNCFAGNLVEGVPSPAVHVGEAYKGVVHGQLM